MKWQITIRHDDGDYGIQLNYREGDDDLPLLLYDCLRGLLYQPWIIAIAILSQDLEFGKIEHNKKIADAAYEFLKICHKQGNSVVRDRIDNFYYEEK